jgi:hypothetical protein
VKVQFRVIENTKVLNRSGARNDRMTEAVSKRQYVGFFGVRHKARFIAVKSH